MRYNNSVPSMNISFPKTLQGLLKKKCKQYLYKNCISPVTKREASWSKEKKYVGCLRNFMPEVFQSQKTEIYL